MKTRRKAGHGTNKQAAARKPMKAKRPAAQRSAAPSSRTSTKVAVPSSRKSAQRTAPLKAARRANKSATHDTGLATSDQTPGSAATSLANDCTIAQAGDIKSQLSKVLTNAAPVAIDLSNVRRIDTAGLQVLAAFIRERRAAGREVRCEGATEAFQVTATLLGLGALFSPAMDDRLSAPAAGNA